MRKKLLALLCLLVAAAGAHQLWLAREQARPEGVADAPLAKQLIEKYGRPHYSKALEELIIRDFFGDRREGFFLDVGAFDYKQNSNTYYLDKHLDWSGIAIDAQREFEAGYLEHRPRTRFHAFFVSDRSDETAAFFVVSGRKQLSTAVKERVGHRAHEELEVPTITLDDLLDGSGVEKVDFLTMDIERWEPKALAGFDIRRFRPELVCIEAHELVNDEILAYFDANGYVRMDEYLPLDERNWYFRPAPELVRQ